MGYRVEVDDNFHFMNESYRYQAGEFETYEEAMAVARGIVDDNLRRLREAGDTASTLYTKYMSFGEDPFIIPRLAGKQFSPLPVRNPGGKPAFIFPRLAGTHFSAWGYAEERSAEICQEPEDSIAPMDPARAARVEAFRRTLDAVAKDSNAEVSVEPHPPSGGRYRKREAP